MGVLRELRHYGPGVAKEDTPRQRGSQSRHPESFAWSNVVTSMLLSASDSKIPLGVLVAEQL